MIASDNKDLYTLLEKAWRKLEAEFKDVARTKKRKKKRINAASQIVAPAQIPTQAFLCPKWNNKKREFCFPI